MSFAQHCNLTNVLVFVLVLLFQTSYAQSAVEVTDRSFKLDARSKETFYFKFAEGDKIIIDFKELDGREIKSFEVAELSGSSKFMAYKTTEVLAKQVMIDRTGIHKVSVINSALAGRVCKLNIRRVPKSRSTLNFNTTVYSERRGDSIVLSTTERHLQQIDTVAIALVNQIAKVSSKSALNGNSNKTIVDFTLPEGTVSWAYYIGVGSEGMKAEADARTRFLNTSASLLSKFEGYGTMAALALHGINAFDKAQGDDNVKYYIFPNNSNLQKFRAGEKFSYIKQGDVVNDAVQMKHPLKGKVFLGLLNDNLVEPIDVLVKVTAVQIKHKWTTSLVQSAVIKAAD